MDHRGDLDAQRARWEAAFLKTRDMFGEAPSTPAIKAAGVLAQAGCANLLELGPGQGRDTLFFACGGLRVTALDYSQTGLDAIVAKAEGAHAASRVTPICHDVRQSLPFPGESFDACYSHMLFCMALTTPELERLSAEVRRVLRPGGINVYTVRHAQDAHYGTGIHRGEDLYEVGGFIVHFFSREKVVQLAEGWELLAVDEFEEGGLPRRLFRVTLRKPASAIERATG